MKRSLFTLAVLAIALLSLAQAPNSFNYQAVVRAADGSIVQNTNVSFRFSVLQGSAVGSSVYVETHTAFANQYGVVNVVIGEGAVVSGDFSAVEWGGDAYFLKVDMDINGGSSFTDMTTQQLVAVPYALHAQTVSKSDNDTANEHQELSLSGTDLTLTKNGGTVSIADDDSDPANEIQHLEVVGDSLGLSSSTANVGLNDINHWTLNNNRLSANYNAVGIGTQTPSTTYELQVVSDNTKRYNISASNSIATNGGAINQNLFTSRSSSTTGSTWGLHSEVSYSPKIGSTVDRTIGISSLVNTGPDDAASVSTYGVSNTINRSDSGNGTTYGYFLDLNHTGNDGSVYGGYFNVDATGNNGDPVYGIYNTTQKIGTGTLYGHRNLVLRNASTAGTTVGLRTSLSYSPNSGTTGYALDGEQIVLTTNPTVSVEPRGQYIDVNRGGTGTGRTIGSHIDVRHTTSGLLYGIYNEVERTSTSSTSATYGLRNLITSTGGSTYGTYTSATVGSDISTTLGSLYGSYATITRYGAINANTYGGRFSGSNRTTGTGTRTAYGVYGYAYQYSANGTSRTYGIYGTIAGSGDIEYAGYFNGDVYSSGSYLPSDAKLKTNVGLQEASLDRILKLKVYQYEYKTDRFAHMNLPEGKQTGFIAGDMKGVFPELTKESYQPPLEEDEIENLLKDGYDVSDEARNGVDYTAVNYAGLVPHLTLSIQEQQKVLLKQEHRIDELEEVVHLLRQEVLELQNELNK